MPRKGEHLPWPDLGPRDGAAGLSELAQSYLKHMQARGLSKHTINGHSQGLKRFFVWCGDRDIATPIDLQLPELESFQYFLSRQRKSNGHPLGQRSQRYSLDIVRQMMRYGHKRGWIELNPADLLELPKVPKRLPMHSLTPPEVEKVLAQPNVRTAEGLRDRAMLELMYSAGLRRGELVKLTIGDLDFNRGIVRVHQGKGNKDRVTPVGERALGWLRSYVQDGRGELASPAEPVLFVTAQHEGQMNPEFITHRFGKYVRKVSKNGACHIFRHTMATLMMEGGADIRFVQEMLGHTSLTTTQIYTHVSVEKLREVHAATHPAEAAAVEETPVATSQTAEQGVD